MKELDPDNDPWHWAAVELRKFRKGSGRTLQDIAAIIDRDTSLVSKFESGDAHLQLKHAEAIDAALKTDGTLSRIVHLALSRHRGEWAAEAVDREQESDRLSAWSLGWVPALLQTPEYARAVFIGCGVTDVEDAVKKRIRRQDVLGGVHARFLIAQSALEDVIGAPEVQRAQLARLLERSEQHPIRVVPRTAGSHPGKDGSFTIYSKAGRDTAVWATTLGPGRLVTDRTEVSSYRVWFDRIGDQGLPIDASVSMIREIMEDLS